MKTLFTIFLLFAFSVLWCGSSTAQVVINEYSVSNLSGFADNYSKYEDWIELYNTSSVAVNLSGYGLSDKIDNPGKWLFPAGTTIPANGFIRLWASGRNVADANGHYHTNFKLSQTKDEPEHVVLSGPFGAIIDQVQLEITQKEHSRGRATDGGETWALFINPTPKNSNIPANAYVRYTFKPSIDVEAGFYNEPIEVTLSTEEPDGTIRYTIDGSDVSSSSAVYSSAISITETTILKARTYSADNTVLPGLMTFNTYFINEIHTLAVMSLSAAQLDDLLNGNQGLTPFGTFEYFNKQGQRTTVGYGEFNEHGQDSWVHPQRSIDYISRDECGYNYAIREKLISLTDRDEFQRIILRAAGDDNYPGIDTSALLRDLFVQNTATRNGMHLDTRKGEKGVIYVNGIYWGIYGFREKVSDHDFTDYYYDQDKYHLYYLKLWGSSWAEYGGEAAWQDWNALHDFIKTQNLTLDENWEYVDSRFDYKSLVDYVHINSFVVCSDWINWNVGWWRGTNPEGGHQKWGYVLWDEDATFAHYINYTGVPGISPTTSPCFPEGLPYDPEEHILVLNKLRANPEFNQYYISRYIDLYNTAFRPESMIGYLDSLEALMEPEFQHHVDRWGGTVQQWKNNVQKIRNFITSRHNYLPQGFDECWNLEGPYEFTVQAQPAGVGGVQLNSLMLTQFPFDAQYFGGIDMVAEALELNPNYRFDHWQLNNHSIFPDSISKSITFQLSTNDMLTAHFVEKLFADSLVINEINYNSADGFDAGDWVEFYNPHPYGLNLGGWIFKDEDDSHSFVFPAGTDIPGEEYLVLVEDSTLFMQQFPAVENFVGNTGFGFSGGGELLRLYNDEGVLIDTVRYDDEAPWPVEPDGNGPTLELILPHYDNALAQSWMASPLHGTPGEMNSFWVALPEPEPLVKEVSIRVVPNPFSESAIIQILTDEKVTNGSFSVFNIYGKLVRHYDHIRAARFALPQENLAKGMYLFRFDDSETRISGNGKFVIE
ncbi:MAG: hypothetical protein EOM83_14240 [Clostridia bacterium]|nr:hypothetical protein [Clostridia bacterium]